MIALLKLIVKDECHSYEFNRNNQWTKPIYQDFLCSTLQNINHFLFHKDILDDDETFLPTMFDLIIHIFQIIPFDELLKTEFVIKAIKALHNHAEVYPKKYFHVGVIFHLKKNLDFFLKLFILQGDQFIP